LIGMDSVDTRLERALGAGKRAVADLQLNDVFAARFQRPGNGENIECGFGRESARELAESNSAHALLIGEFAMKNTKRHKKKGHQTAAFCVFLCFLWRVYCLLAIACASGLITEGRMWLSTRSWQVLR